MKILQIIRQNQSAERNDEMRKRLKTKKRDCSLLNMRQSLFEFP